VTPGLPLALTPRHPLALTPEHPLALTPGHPFSLTFGLSLGPQPHNPLALVASQRLGLRQLNIVAKFSDHFKYSMILETMLQGVCLG